MAGPVARRLDQIANGAMGALGLFMPMIGDHDREEWRRVKSRRGIELADAAVLSGGRPFVETPDRESDPDEVRFRRAGFDRRGRLVTLVYTWRSGRPRAITVWSATRDEAWNYREEHAS